MELNEKFLSPCGLYCGVCGVYYATRDSNHRFLEKLLSFYQNAMPGLEDITVKDLECDGCFSENRSLFCQACAIKDCNHKKGYSGCHECDDFPCEFILNEWPPGASTGRDAYTHEGEECGLLLEGTINVEIDGQTYRMKPGDTITLKSSVPHRIWNPGKQKAVAVWVNTVPWMFAIK